MKRNIFDELLRRHKGKGAQWANERGDGDGDLQTFRSKTWKPAPPSVKGKDVWGGTGQAAGPTGMEAGDSDVDLSDVRCWGLTTVEECNAARFNTKTKPE
mmetsp:Transcript_51482/g.104776  ORF Transcript_51482/g.104776 Transcript_51482/m.104776 type:complete len:100 (+) Transcript_51482:264-563(+)